MNLSTRIAQIYIKTLRMLTRPRETIIQECHKTRADKNAENLQIHSEWQHCGNAIIHITRGGHRGENAIKQW